jgi:hypothetical protein
MRKHVEPSDVILKTSSFLTGEAYPLTPNLSRQERGKLGRICGNGDLVVGISGGLAQPEQE